MVDMSTPEGIEQLAQFLREQGMAEAGVRAQVRTQEILNDLYAKNPDLPFITAHVLASDMRQAEDATRRVAEGEDPIKALVWVGSFARFGWALENCPWDYVYENICELWRGSDPDDSNPNFLAAWQRAWFQNKRVTIRDGKRLPVRNFLKVYRGQMPGDKMGISWSLDMAVADKFASGAAFRTPMPGVLYSGVVPREAVMGYMTGRGEAECIINPVLVGAVKQIKQYVRVEKDA